MELKFGIYLGFGNWDLLFGTLEAIRHVHCSLPKLITCNVPDTFPDGSSPPQYSP